MKFLFSLVLLMTCAEVVAQNGSACRVDIYLVKKRIPCWDSAAKKIIPFTVTLEDLQDTAFIKNEEIVSYTFIKFRQKAGKGKKVMARLHSIKTISSLAGRVDSLGLSLFGCARQFAIVCDGEIIYGGCLNNILSSWVPPCVFATALANDFDLNLWRSLGSTDPRENVKLFNCLKSTGRLTLLKN